jgi:omega-6 fatty acid desaturase (delta-12 desaturase)
MTRKERWDIYFTNVMLVIVAASISLIIGFKAYLLIQVPIVLIAHSLGIWLFYVQHQFEDVSWERNSQWNYKMAAIQGSSFLKLPVILQWFTGNIGFHHVHHLSSKIPNYNLARCHYENDLFKAVKPIQLFAGFKALSLNLWDETSRQMVSFKEV